ncbi:hypothetical protein, partial [Colwellia sp.]|uniref:hypothetical protein n=1 Tax=Colwellia sp. TaxID=56799 RepID=UPI0025BFDE46
MHVFSLIFALKKFAIFTLELTLTLLTNIYFRSSLAIYTQATSRCWIQLELETSLGKPLIEENDYSLF